jgi:catechol 2,3-dioxygenase-like lactoylglutathione lyase family enzyme
MERGVLKWPNWVGVVVEDLEAQRRFYGEVLGLRELEVGEDWAQFDMEFMESDIAEPLRRTCPNRSPGTAGTPLPDEVKRGLLAALSDLPLEFVSDDDTVIIPVEEGGGVKDEGVVVTVGPIPPGDDQVEVEASLYAGPLAATWLTYVVKRSSQGWRVAGTTGPVAIS